MTIRPHVKWALAAVAAVLLAAGAGGLARLRREAPGAPAPVVVPAVAPPGEVSLPGKIAAQHVIPVAPEAGGQIDAFLADVGQEVYEGQVLARLSNQELETARESAAAASENTQARVNRIEGGIIAARLEASRAQADLTRVRGAFERAQRGFERQKMLNEAGATPRMTYEKSQQEFQLAERDLSAAEALARQADEHTAELARELESARKILDDKRRQLEEAQSGLQATEVHSPVSGLVVARRGEAGKPLDPASEMFQIATDLSALRVDLEAEPAVLARLKPGQAALVFVADVPDGISGQVSAVEKGRASVTFLTPSAVVRLGMTAQVRIRLGAAGAGAGSLLK